MTDDRKELELNPPGYRYLVQNAGLNSDIIREDGLRANGSDAMAYNDGKSHIDDVYQKKLELLDDAVQAITKVAENVPEIEDYEFIGSLLVKIRSAKNKLTH